jgi:hypothetical protein
MTEPVLSWCQVLPDGDGLQNKVSRSLGSLPWSGSGFSIERVIGVTARIESAEGLTIVRIQR